MAHESVRERLLVLFAGILDYPSPNIVNELAECQALLASSSAEVAALLQEFQVLAEGSSDGRLEELYTGVFDLDPICHPYVGYHLFGESYKRSAFLVELKEQYRAHGFDMPGAELADRVSVLLRFLSICDDEELRREIITEGMLPALDTMIDGKGKRNTERQAEEKLASAITQLEGEGSEEEVLQGGFVLEMTEETSNGSRRPSKGGNPYQPVLKALRLVLESPDLMGIKKQGAGAAYAGGGDNA